MSNLITLREVKEHCRIDYDDEDTLLQLYIDAAIETCQKHIGKRFDNDLEFKPAIKVGCLLYIGTLYDNRETVADLTIKEIPHTIDMLWSVYRDPAIY
ncbi:phage gp6-like head-tail connector protein [Frischella sp. Ac48]|uniref:head-tail connector protein n=1 Tax=Frischella sp. Ac48 TaxID=2804531 RepID=UPI001C7DF400|nr:head-tail connector protein [Frischella sp. Ac48]MBX4132364.1 phage gp6-like head-tail connector protein [Frischella sp. Ac48]